MPAFNVQGKITAQSAYSPLDLFSGDESRMRKALQCLMHNPQNNLAVHSSERGIAQVPTTASAPLSGPATDHDAGAQMLLCNSGGTDDFIALVAVRSMLAWGMSG